MMHLLTSAYMSEQEQVLIGMSSVASFKNNLLIRLNILFSLLWGDINTDTHVVNRSSHTGRKQGDRR